MNYLEIESVIGREILDSRGNPTVEAEITPVSYTHLDVYKRQFLHLAAEEAGGLEQQHDDQDGKRNGILPGGKTDGGDKALAQADGNAADHCTRDGADAAQNGGNKGFQAQHGACLLYTSERRVVCAGSRQHPEPCHAGTVR